MGISVLYSVRVPYSEDDLMIEVYGEADMGWYEWRVVHNTLSTNTFKMFQKIRRDTGRDNNGMGVGYGSAEIALRDALIEMSEGL